MCQLKTKRYEAVEISVPSGTTASKFFFPNLPNLTSYDGKPVSIESIVVFSNSATPKSALTGTDVVSDADLQKCYLTIIQGSDSVILNMPVVALSYVNGFTDSRFPQTMVQPLLDSLIDISWTKSYISIPTGTITGATSFNIGIFYSY